MYFVIIEIVHELGKNSNLIMIRYHMTIPNALNINMNSGESWTGMN